MYIYIHSVIVVDVFVVVSTAAVHVHMAVGYVFVYYERIYYTQLLMCCYSLNIISVSLWPIE